ncbi:hypothetical protein [Sulfurospirillum arcachonense]|uniref:hypothetical protein n=1 Tax=Sulfurospirillum arcachonense TaxID=57666 RepID=UPI000469598E|nr:hypothetical protein [Sulfurospirillum arcachonense]
MKYFLIFVSVLFLLLGCVFLALFTQSGNNLLKPYLEKYIQKSFQKDVHIETLTLRTNFIDAEITVGENSKVIVNGDFNILREDFDVEYMVDANNIKTAYVNIAGDLHVKGKLKGNIDEFQANGAGRAFHSPLSFLTNVQNKKLKDIKLNAKNIKIEEILAFLKKPIYSKGMIDINADIKSIGEEKYKGDGNIIIHYGTLSNQLLEKDFGIKLKDIVTYRGTIKSNIDGDKLYAKSDIFSNIAKIETKKTQYDLKKEIFYSDYSVKIADMSVFQKTINTVLQGSLIVDGNIQKDKQDFSFDVNTNSLGGSFKAIVFNDTMKVNAKSVNLSKIMTMFKQPRYSDGDLNLTLDMDALSQKKGKFTLHVDHAKLYGVELKKLVDMEFPSIIDYEIKAQGDIKNNLVFFKANMPSDISNLDITQSQFDIDTSKLNGKYALHVEDLTKLAFATKREMQGKVDVDGKYGIEKGVVTLDGKSDFLDAKTTFNLKDNLLHVKSEDLSTLKLTDMMSYPKVFDSFASLQADYNVINKQGIFEVNALNGKILKTELSDILLAVSGFDLTQEVYKDTLLRGVIDNNQVDFTLLMNGLESYFKVPSGSIDLEEHNIKSDFEVKIQHRDFQGSIEGKLDKPSVELNGSEYLKQKIDKAIDKNVPEEWQDTAKGLLKLFN